MQICRYAENFKLESFLITLMLVGTSSYDLTSKLSKMSVTTFLYLRGTSKLDYANRYSGVTYIQAPIMASATTAGGKAGTSTLTEKSVSYSIHKTRTSCCFKHLWPLVRL